MTVPQHRLSTCGRRWPDDFQCSVRSSSVRPFSQHGNFYSTRHPYSWAIDTFGALDNCCRWDSVSTSSCLSTSMGDTIRYDTMEE